MDATQEDASARDKERGLKAYAHGRASVFAHRPDPRFSWTVYVPPHGPGERLDLLVSMHGTLRNVAEYRDLFVDFGRWNRCVVLAPLFPIGVLGDDNRDGYKYIQEADIRYDHVLLEMVDEVGRRYPVRADRFGLFGFSGGGQFANRFFLLHPERLWAVSIGAPGSVTLLDDTKDWWVGTANAQGLMGVRPDPARLGSVPVQLVVGGADTETWGVTHHPDGPHWMQGANCAGATRPERLASLQRSLRDNDIDAQLDIVPGVSHSAPGVADTVKTFLARALQRHRDAEST